MKYKVIFFDLDNTLLDFNRAELYAFEKTIRVSGYPYSKAVYNLYDTYNNELWNALEQGKMDIGVLKIERFRYLIEKLNLVYNPKEMSKLYEKHLGEVAYEMKNAYEVCSSLNKKYTLAIITNGILAVQKNRMAQCRLTPLMKEIFISEEVGISKPDAGIFEYALSKMGVTKEEALMVGDSLTSDMQGSIGVGMDCCFLNPNCFEATLPVTYEIKKLEELLDIL